MQFKNFNEAWKYATGQVKVEELPKYKEKKAEPKEEKPKKKSPKKKKEG